MVDTTPRKLLGKRAMTRFGWVSPKISSDSCSLGVIASLFLTSCAIGPDYHRPAAAESGVPASWRGTLPHEGSIADLAVWWERFDDPALAHLVVVAEENSPTIAEALGKVREARASVTSSRASFWPSITGAGSVTRGNGGADNVADPELATTASASIDASWELDLFGKNRRGLQAAEARYESAQAEWHDARVTLAAEVAFAFTSARQLQRLIALYEQELASRRTSEQLIALKIREGLAPPTDVLSVTASTAEAADLLASERGRYAQVCDQLVMLTGLTYAEVRSAVGSSGEIPRTGSSLELAMPAKVLAQRPDVRVSENLLRAASAEIGVALAETLPSLSLMGSIGVNSARGGGTSTTSRTWAFGPALNLPLFRGGANAAKVEATRARYDQALAIYRSSVLTAVREIEDALVRIDTVARRIGLSRQAAENYAAYFNATERSYREGGASLLELEEARRRSLGAQVLFLSVQLERAQSWIALYKALGGGWPAPTSVEPTHP